MTEFSCFPFWMFEKIFTNTRIAKKSETKDIFNSNMENNFTRQTNNSKRPLRIALIGAPNVGKSALTVRFLTNRFIYDYRSDVDLMYRSCIKINGQDIPVELLDTSSNLQELSRCYIEWADVTIFVYSITDISSFTTIKEYIKILCDYKPENSTLLLGTKCDMEHSREVSEEEGRNLASECNSHFKEISALSEYITLHTTLMSFIESLKLLPVYVNSSSSLSINTMKHSTAINLLLKQKVTVSKIFGLLIGKIPAKSTAPITQLVALDKAQFSKTYYPLRQL